MNRLILSILLAAHTVPGSGLERPEPMAGPVHQEAQAVPQSLSTEINERFSSCAGKVHNQNKPRVWWFQRGLDHTDPKAANAPEFLRALLNRLERAADENITFSKNIQFCMSKAGTTSGCRDMRREWIEADGGLKFKVEEARYYLALAQGPTDMRTIMGASNDGVNYKLWTTGIHKEVKWKPMTPSETRAAKLVLKNHEDEVRSKIRGRGLNGHSYESRRQFMDEMIPIRRGYWKAYETTLSSVPLLQFISSLNPSDDEIAWAAKQQGQLALRERTKIRGWKMRLESSKNGLFPYDLLEAFEYQNAVEDVLTNNPQFCGVAMGLAELREQRALGNAAVPAAALLVVSTLVPPAAAVGLGLAAGVVGARESYKEFQEARTRALAEAVAENGLSSASDLNERYQNFTESMTVDMAMNSLGAGSVSKGAASLRSRKLFESVLSAKPGAVRPVPVAFRTTPIN